MRNDLLYGENDVLPVSSQVQPEKKGRKETITYPALRPLRSVFLLVTVVFLACCFLLCALLSIRFFSAAFLSSIYCEFSGLITGPGPLAATALIAEDVSSLAFAAIVLNPFRKISSVKAVYLFMCGLVAEISESDLW